jgi:hypothetical protein
MAKPTTSSPTASTTPANSLHKTVCFGFVTPVKPRMNHG